MDSIGIVLIILLLAAAVGVVIWYLMQRRKAQGSHGSRPPEDVIGDANKPTADALRGLRNGDMVERGIQKWFVRGRLDFDEEGYRWTEHLLDDAENKVWVSVEDEESFEAALWKSVPLGDIEQGQVGDRDVIVSAVAYRLQERGEANFTADGATGTAPTGRMEYADYKSADGKLLGFEKFGSGWEVAVGEVVQPWELTVYPASDRPPAQS